MVSFAMARIVDGGQRQEKEVDGNGYGLDGR
jgi:hypothetical protein